jgi:hypothetical protein
LQQKQGLPAQFCRGKAQGCSCSFAFHICQLARSSPSEDKLVLGFVWCGSRGGGKSSVRWCGGGSGGAWGGSRSGQDRGGGGGGAAPWGGGRSGGGVTPPSLLRSRSHGRSTRRCPFPVLPTDTNPGRWGTGTSTHASTRRYQPQVRIVVLIGQHTFGTAQIGEPAASAAALLATRTLYTGGREQIEPHALHVAAARGRALLHLPHGWRRRMHCACTCPCMRRSVGHRGDAAL